MLVLAQGLGVAIHGLRTSLPRAAAPTSSLFAFDEDMQLREREPTHTDCAAGKGVQRFQKLGIVDDA